MSLRGFISIVASPRPRVGKTMLARLLADFHLHNDRNVSAFDLNAPDFELAQFLPEHAAAADIAEVKGQMELFDALVRDDRTYRVVDVGAAAFERFFLLARDINFASEARKRGLAPVVFYVIGADPVSVDGYAALARLFPDAIMVPVHNAFLGQAQYRDRFPPRGKGSALVPIPALAPGVRRATERKPMSFNEVFSAQAGDAPHDIGAELQRWLRKIFLELRELELRVLMADLQSSITP